MALMPRKYFSLYQDQLQIQIYILMNYSKCKKYINLKEL